MGASQKQCIHVWRPFGLSKDAAAPARDMDEVCEREEALDLRAALASEIPVGEGPCAEDS